MGIRSFFGFGSSTSNSSSSSGSSGGMSPSGWHRYDPDQARREQGQREPDVASAPTGRSGRRIPTPDPYASPGAPVVRNFGRPYSDQ
ncbi:hypothetical protein [Kitasatospora sp. GP82]|uniref:hypothetical protein n=1 Tax=Kitasatospora sp. GP82 TaxID=3035089 RepID=UPI0024732CDB|nr:hypothetical protein [Kitasatospora sp. GP82]MDH6126904.1 hypothetical protein [Kitasatospora sp. GP82]